MTQEPAEHASPAPTPSESGTTGLTDCGTLSAAIGRAQQTGVALSSVVDERTVDVDPALDEDAFFTTTAGTEALVTRYDLEQAVSTDAKTHLREVDRYWVDEPHAFVIVFWSVTENEAKYYVVQPHLTRAEMDLLTFLTAELRSSIPYAEERETASRAERCAVVVDEYRRLLDRYDLSPRALPGGDAEEREPNTGGPRYRSTAWISDTVDAATEAIARFTAEAVRIPERFSGGRTAPRATGATNSSADSTTLSPTQVAKLEYHLTCTVVGYGAIDPITHDVRVEDISCDGYDAPVFVHHTEHEQLITNVQHAREELDNFVRRLAQEAGSGISTRRPQVDATLPDGSRAQLTLGHTVADHGTNYTIRQFADVPYTPVDLLNWGTFSLDQMAFLWLCVENDKNLIFAGGTASGKTTCLNAISLFIPSNAKIVSIEDTREVELPQRNWIASVTRPGFSADDNDAIDEFDLLESALRQRPEYIIVGEVRGEEGRTAFQVMSTGHTTYTTFHADSVDEVLRRFTTDPINVSKSMFTALDLVCVQRSTRTGGQRVRRNTSITEVNRYDPENDEITVKDVFRWRADADAFEQSAESSILEQIRRERGWSRRRLEMALRRRRVVLSYLITQEITDYAAVAATLQATIRDPEAVLESIATETLEASLDGLRTMESVQIDVDPEAEAMTPRPSPNDATRERAAAVLAEATPLLSTRVQTSYVESGDHQSSGAHATPPGGARSFVDIADARQGDITQRHRTHDHQTEGEVDG